MPNETKLLGAFGEDAACRWLRRHGYRILERNFSCRFGEIDIIARKGRYLAFVEVKMRKNADHGAAMEFVTPAKQNRLIQTAEYWLMKTPTDLQPRFDVVEVYAPEGISTRKPEINHLEDAFQL